MKFLKKICNKIFTKPIIITFWFIVSLLNIFWLHSYYRSSIGYTPEQPVKFSHKTHSKKFGIKCIYCHSNAENTPTAGIPSTKTCMICHSGLDTKPEQLASTFESFEKNIPLIWNKVYRLPDYTHFNHSRHIRVCIDCSSCHGEVEKEDKVSRIRKLNMLWCLDCHRNPEKYIIFARQISGIFTFNIDSLQYFRKLKDKNISASEYGSYQSKNEKQIINGIAIPKHPGLGSENCSACHY